MNFPQFLVFWTMVAAMFCTFRDMERSRYIKKVDGLEPVNRRLIGFANGSQKADKGVLSDLRQK